MGTSTYTLVFLYCIFQRIKNRCLRVMNSLWLKNFFLVALEQLRDSIEEIRSYASGGNMLWGGGRDGARSSYGQGPIKKKLLVGANRLNF
jgi:hypothetical protein